MISLADMMNLILDNACPQSVEEKLEDGKINRYLTFYIETHCVAWTITTLRKFGRWEIVSQTSEDC